MQEMHDEFLAKYDEPNRGLKPESERWLPGAKSQQHPEWKRLFDEFQAKCATKNAKMD